MRSDYETTATRIAVALVVGAIVGSWLTSWAFVAPATRAGLRYFDFDTTIHLFSGTTIIAFIVVSAGLLVFGAPAWWFLHRLGRRGPLAALLLGATLTFAVVFFAFTYDEVFPTPSTFYAEDIGGAFVSDGRRTPYGWIQVTVRSTEEGIAGGLTGLLIWRIAYLRRPTKGTVPLDATRSGYLP